MRHVASREPCCARSHVTWSHYPLAEAPEMEFEVARCRPMLGDDFFAYLDRRIGGPRVLGGTQ